MKRIALVTIGTQGDVQPYLALAIALQERGYGVVLGATEEFEDLVTGYGLEFHSLGPSIQSFLKESRFESAMSTSMLINGPALLRQGQLAAGGHEETQRGHGEEQAHAPYGDACSTQQQIGQQ